MWRKVIFVHANELLGSRQCCMQQQAVKAKEGSNFPGISTSAAWLPRSCSSQYPSATPQEYPQLSPLCISFPGHHCQLHAADLAFSSVRAGSMLAQQSSWCSCSPVKQMLLSQQRTSAGWLLPSHHHWHQHIFSAIHLQIFTWMTGTSHPACHQSGLGFDNISNYFCYRQNRVLEPRSLLGSLRVVSSGESAGSTCWHHGRDVALRSTGFQAILLQGEWEAAGHPGLVLSRPASRLGLSSSKAPFGINWSVLCFSLTQLFSTATDDWTQEGM